MGSTESSIARERLIMERAELAQASAKLREETGTSMYDCRKVLALNDFDMDKAREWLKQYYFDSHGFRREIKEGQPRL